MVKEKPISPENAESLREEILLIRNKIVVAHLGNNVDRLPMPLTIEGLNEKLPCVLVTQDQLSDFVQNLTPDLKAACAGNINDQFAINISPDGEFTDNDGAIYCTEMDKLYGLLESCACITDQQFRNLRNLYWVKSVDDKQAESVESWMKRYIDEHKVELLKGLKKSMTVALERVSRNSISSES